MTPERDTCRGRPACQFDDEVHVVRRAVGPGARIGDEETANHPADEDHSVPHVAEHKDGLYVISAVLDADRPERFLVAFLRHWENTQGVIMRKVDWPSRPSSALQSLVSMMLVIGMAVALARVRRSRDVSLHPSPRRYLLASVGFAGLLQFGVQMFELQPPNSVQTSDRHERLSAHPDWCRGHR